MDCRYVIHRGVESSASSRDLRIVPDLRSQQERTRMTDRERMEDVGFMTCMTLALLGNYAQTGHFGGPLAYTPFNVVTHLAGPDNGGLRYDYRRPKHPYSDKFMLAAGPLRADLLRAVDDHGRGARAPASGDRRPRYYVAPDVAMLSVDALGFRRGAGALKTLLADQRPRRSSAVRAGEGPRHPRAVRAHRVHRRHQRRQRRTVGRRHRHGRRQGRVLGHRRRADGRAEDHRVRGRVRDVRRPRAGAQDAGASRCRSASGSASSSPTTTPASTMR